MVGHFVGPRLGNTLSGFLALGGRATEVTGFEAVLSLVDDAKIDVAETDQPVVVLELPESYELSVQCLG